MTDLKTLQTHLQNHIQTEKNTIHPFIISTAHVSKEQRLAIYQEGYIVRLTEALVSNYPCLRELMGEKAFGALAQEYIQNKPSSFRSIRWFGHELSSYLKQKTAFPEAELAEFEWKIGETFDAADDPLLDITILESIEPTQFITRQFRFHSSARRINCSFNTPALWQALTQRIEPLEPIQCSTAEKKSLNAFRTHQETQWVVWRHQYDTKFYKLTTIEARIMDEAMQGASFIALCEHLLDVLPESEVAAHTAAFLKGWITRGLISKLY